MRLCVIGNSHVGMLRAAVRERGSGAPDITFFAKAGAGLERAAIRGSVIAAEDAGLREAQARFAMPAEVDVADFDAVIFVAGTVSVYSALRLLQGARVSGWSMQPDPCGTIGKPSDGAADGRIGDPARAAGEDGPPRQCLPGETGAADNGADDDLPAKVLLSEPAFVAALADAARAGVSYRFATALRHSSDVPMFLVPQPYPSERVFESTRPQEFGFLRARRQGHGAAIARCLARATDTAFAGIAGLTVLHQPPDTVAFGFTTALAYTRDAVRVDGETPQVPADLLHVGPAFGRRVLARVEAALAAMPGTGRPRASPDFRRRGSARPHGVKTARDRPPGRPVGRVARETGGP